MLTHYTKMVNIVNVTLHFHFELACRHEHLAHLAAHSVQRHRPASMAAHSYKAFPICIRCHRA